MENNNDPLANIPTALTDTLSKLMELSQAISNAAEVSF